MGEVANAVEIGCRDCHGTTSAYPNLRTSGPAAAPQGADLTLLRNSDGRRRFEWIERDGSRVLMQRSVIDPALEWEVSLVKDSVDRTSISFNSDAARAKLMSQLGVSDGGQAWVPGVASENLAHKDSEMECYACHTSWTAFLRRLSLTDRSELDDGIQSIRRRTHAELRDL